MSIQCLDNWASKLIKQSFKYKSLVLATAVCGRANQIPSQRERRHESGITGVVAGVSNDWFIATEQPNFSGA